MTDYKPQLQTVLFDLNNKSHCLLQKKATELKTKVEAYLKGEITLPDTIEKKVADLKHTTDTISPVAVIEINGIICKRLGLPQEIMEFFGLVDLSYIDAQLKGALADETITAVIINVCSPGGFITGVQSTAKLIGKLAAVKDTVVYSDVLNASAAYWLSSQASAIIVSEDVDMGSVGVYTHVTDISKALENEGVKVHLIKAGKYKAIDDSTQPLTDEAKAFLQEEVNQTWETFKSAVNNKRMVAEEDMQGQTFNGITAIKKGLADGIADSIEEVMAALI